MISAIAITFVPVKKGKLIVFSGILTTIAVAMILAWSGYTFFELEKRTLAEHVEELIHGSAEKTREKNRTLNNLMASYNEEDGAEKQAFAIGMTGNVGRMHMYFDEEEKEEKPTDTGVILINKDTLVNMGIKFIPTSVRGISYFDSLLKDTVNTENIALEYTIVPQRRGAEKTFHTDSTASLYTYHCRPFIINYYKPDVFRVNYSLNPKDIINNMWHYMFAALFILFLVPAAFIMYYRAYKLQVQAGNFKEALFSNITHELKTPLSSLQLIMEEQQNGNEYEDEKVAFALAELNRMKLIVDKILSYGKLDHEEFALNVEVVDISGIIADAVYAMKIACQQKNVMLESNTEENLKIAGDKALLVNMLTSLIDNAIKYNTDNQPRVSVTATKEDNHIVINISDNGVGIPQEYKDKIFEPFFRIPTGDVHDTKGNGLGLSFVAQVVSLHNGTIIVSGHKPVGTNFKIQFPL